ncbi:MAG: hypothetical protein ACRDVE_14070, partial [Actinocrinis sp.]
VDIEPDQRDHGGGRAGRSRPAGQLTVYSLVRGAWELRVAQIDDLCDGLDPAALRLRVAGWPVAGGTPSEVTATRATVVGAGLISSLQAVPIEGAADEESGTASVAGVSVHQDAGPLGSPVLVPWLEHAVRSGAWVATLVELSGNGGHPVYGPCRVVHDPLGVLVEWPDGRSTITHDPGPLRALVSKERG